MAKQIKDRCVRSLQVFPQPTAKLALISLRETGWAQLQLDLVARRTLSHLARASRNSNPRDAAKTIYPLPDPFLKLLPAL